MYLIASFVEFFVILCGNWKSSLKDDPNTTTLNVANSGRFSSASNKTCNKNHVHTVRTIKTVLFWKAKLYTDKVCI